MPKGTNQKLKLYYLRNIVKNTILTDFLNAIDNDEKGKQSASKDE